MQRVSTGSIFNVIPISVGDKIDSRKSNDIVRSLFSTEQFDDIQIGKDGNTLIITVAERPSISAIDISGNKALFPDISMADIDGLSATVIIKVFPSLPIWISSNCSVENNDLTISFDFRESILSPTLIGITLKILPVETLCNPIILMSLTKNSSMNF